MTIPNMVAESKNSQLAGHQLQRPRETPPVGTPTQRSGAYFSNSKSSLNFPTSSFSRAENGLENEPTNFTPSQRPLSFRSLTHSVRGRGGGRGRGRAGAFSSRPYHTPSTRATAKALQRVFDEDSEARRPFLTTYDSRIPSSVTPSRREMALSHPSLERQYAEQMKMEDPTELKVDANGYVVAPHNRTQSERQPVDQPDTGRPNFLKNSCLAWRAKESSSCSMNWQFRKLKRHPFRRSWTR